MRGKTAICGIGVCIALAVAACQRQQGVPAPASSPTQDSTPAPRSEPDLPDRVRSLLDTSRERMARGEIHDPNYYTIAYPGGDVPDDRGVCTDVVIRAYRRIGIDFQQSIHEDMRKHFSAYPKLWGNASTDTNIDHRRVPNIETFLGRMGASLPVSTDAADYRPGDLVTWRLADGLPHIGIVSDRRAPGSDRPLILHNIGAGTAEDDILFSYRIVGHFRYFPGGA